MKKSFFICILLLVTALGEAASFKSGSKYYISCQGKPNGKIVVGSLHNSETPLLYDVSSETMNDQYWIISKTATGKYSIKNAFTNQYITYNGVYSGTLYRYVTLSQELHGDSSLWNFTLTADNYYVVNNVAIPSHHLHMRSSNVVGTYSYDTDAPGTGSNFCFYDENNEVITMPDTSNGGNSTGILPHIDSLLIGGKPLVYDKLYKTYMLSVSPDYMDKDTMLAKITYLTESGSDTLCIENQAVTSGDSYIFNHPASGTSYQLKAKNGTDTLATVPLTFTFLPIVEINATKLDRTNYNNGTIRVNDGSNMALDSLYTMKIRIRGATATGFSKKPYAIKLIDSAGNSIDRRFIGLRSDNNWILDAMAIDVARMRNRVSTDVWNDFAVKPYYFGSEPKALTGTRGGMTEVILNGSYAGIYCLTEKIDRKQLKLKKYLDDVNDSVAPIRGELFKSTTWSYAVWMGYDGKTKSYPRTALPTYNNSNVSWGGWEAKYPDPGDGETLDWGPFYNAVNLVATGSDEAFKSQLEDYFDLPMVLDYYLYLEFIEGFDNDGKNMYFYIYNMQTTKKFALAPWDMDGTWGRNWDSSTTDSDPTMDFMAFLIKNRGYHCLFSRLDNLNYNDWATSKANRYAELRNTFFTPDKLAQRFLRYHELMKASGAEAREVKRWNGMDVSLDFDEEMVYIANWIKSRITALDKEYGYDATVMKPATQLTYYFTATGDRGSLIIHSNRPQQVRVYTLSGILARTLHVDEGITRISNLSPGIYLVNGQKVLVQ
jgi:hypothetical protein